jgi:thiol-disulfide isomerase/thioredoxin
MKISIRSLSGLALALPFLVSTGLAAEASAHKLSEWKIGKVLFGEKISKGDLKGKVVVLNFWASWCAPAWCWPKARR